MKIISHRGNLIGIDSRHENTEYGIQRAIRNGFDVEIDVWYISSEFWLGHDKPEHKISKNFLDDERLWIHAKNLEALTKLTESYQYLNFFWHQNDDFTLTSKNYIWTYPEKTVTKRSIIVSNSFGDEIMTAYGICTDNPILADQILNNKKNTPEK